MDSQQKHSKPSVRHIASYHITLFAALMAFSALASLSHSTLHAEAGVSPNLLTLQSRGKASGEASSKQYASDPLSAACNAFSVANPKGKQDASRCYMSHQIETFGLTMSPNMCLQKDPTLAHAFNARTAQLLQRILEPLFTRVEMRH